jgi:hypothetical protein
MPYSINSSARPDKGSGIVIPSALAVLRLMTIASDAHHMIAGDRRGEFLLRTGG